jgi:hypothetical protein
MVNHVKLQNMKVVDLWKLSAPQFIALLVPPMILSSRGALMNLRPFYSFGLLCVAALQADCILVCNNDSCEKNFDVLDWCATSKACRVNGQLVTTCGEGSDCPFSRILPGTHYEIPLDEFWPELRTRNDLGFRWDRDFKDETNVAVFLDDVPATEDVCKREVQANFAYVRCPNLPPSIERLEFDFIPPKDGISSDIGMSIGMGDKECVQAHAGECD